MSLEFIQTVISPEKVNMIIIITISYEAKYVWSPRRYKILWTIAARVEVSWNKTDTIKWLKIKQSKVVHWFAVWRLVEVIPWQPLAPLAFGHLIVSVQSSNPQIIEQLQ